MIVPRPGSRTRSVTACLLVGAALGGCGTSSSTARRVVKTPTRAEISRLHAPGSSTHLQSTASVRATTVGTAAPLRHTPTSGAPSSTVGLKAPARAKHRGTGVTTARHVAPVTRGAVTAIVVRRIRHLCRTAPPVTQNLFRANNQSSSSARQLAVAMLPRTLGLQHGLISVLAQAARDPVASAPLLPLVQGLGRLQALLETVAQRQRSAAVTDIQDVARQLDLTAARMGLPQCVVSKLS